MFAEDVAVANPQVADRVRRKTGILGQIAQHRAGMDSVIPAQCGMAGQMRVWADD